MNNRQIRVGRRRATTGRPMEKPTARRGPELYMHGLGSAPLLALEADINKVVSSQEAALNKDVATITGPTTTGTKSVASTPMSPMMLGGIAVGGFLLAKMLRIF